MVMFVDPSRFHHNLGHAIFLHSLVTLVAKPNMVQSRQQIECLMNLLESMLVRKRTLGRSCKCFEQITEVNKFHQSSRCTMAEKEFDLRKYNHIFCKVIE